MIEVDPSTGVGGIVRCSRSLTWMSSVKAGLLEGERRWKQGGERDIYNEDNRSGNQRLCVVGGRKRKEGNVRK